MSNKLERKRQPVFVYEGFGFPVELHNVPMLRVRGGWTPDVDYRELSTRLLDALAHKSSRLTGAEVRFIRTCLSMTLQAFGTRFAVSHPAVMKWEDAGSGPTSMAWATEKDIRLELVRRTRVRAADFVDAYGELAKSRPDQPQRPPVLSLGVAVASTPGRRRSVERGSKAA
ncbi:MAG: hypothetical protein ACREIL_02080 [Nitrospiraceae bacterium]